MLPTSVGCRALALCLAFGFAASAAPAFADPPSWAGMWQVRERYHRPNDVNDEDYRVVYVAQPRVASAQVTVPVARGLPYGFNRGTCDRALLIPTSMEGSLDGITGLDRDCVIGALDHLPDNRQIAWVGEDGEIFRIMPERSYPAAGLLCRDYTASTILSDRKQQTFGTACRLPDGQWEIVD
ncbi:MAG: hypothetical protein H7Y60_13725 [Rhodospirillaceae bacterium]|nr:hypothetical protein [Rhodospirillales bacterium]